MLVDAHALRAIPIDVMREFKMRKISGPESALCGYICRPLYATLSLALTLVWGSVCIADRVSDEQLASIRMPEGFSIEVFADDMPEARSLVLGEQGTLFVSTRKRGDVYAIPLEVDGDGQYRAGKRRTIASDLYMPNGVAFRNGDLYVAEVNRILRFDNIEEQIAASVEAPEFEIIRDDYPSARHHGWRYIAFGPDDKLYVSIGAPCNICDEPGYAVITRLNPDGSDREVFAEGVRNTVGFTWHPDTGVMWFTDNGRDWMGDDLPPCELNRAPRAGMDFGFPHCHGASILDPDFAGKHRCDEFTPPALELGPHVAPLGLKFYTGDQFPEEYRKQLFIAEHGSWNRSEPIGYRIVLVRVEDGNAVSQEIFAEGWLQDGDSWGRPVDLLILPDGSMLVSDDAGGRIFRISYSASKV